LTADLGNTIDGRLKRAISIHEQRSGGVVILHGAPAFPVDAGDIDARPPAEIDQALARLGAALGVLEAAVARRLEAERSKSSLETELALMQDDRARLAVELDGALARANRLDGTVEELARRIDRAIHQVRGVLDGDAAPGSTAP
jgi:hypothetical protein